MKKYLSVFLALIMIAAGTLGGCKALDPAPVSNDPLVIDKTFINCDVGQTHKITITGLPKGYAASDFIWSSGSPNIADVDQNGNVTIRAGEKGEVVTIAVKSTDGKYSNYCLFVVNGVDPPPPPPPPIPSGESNYFKDNQVEILDETGNDEYYYKGIIVSHNKVGRHTDEQWTILWGEKESTNSKVGGGCNLAATSMALSSLDIFVPPKDLRNSEDSQYMKNTGTVACENNCEASKYYGSQTGPDISNAKIDEYLNKYVDDPKKYSPPVIFCPYFYCLKDKKGDYNYEGHYVVVIGKISDTKYHIIDPATGEYSTLCTEENSGKGKECWDVKKKKYASGIVQYNK